MEQPLVSVIVPIYNVEKYLGKCIESIINQTYKNLEIILVNDGSTDNSYDVCMLYAAKDSRITVVQKENGGLASARNKGLEYIHGDYVGFVDSDDWIEEDTYEQMLKAAAENPEHIVMCGRFNVDETTGERTPMFELDGGQCWTREEAVKRFLTWDKIDTSVCDKLFDTNLISGLSFPEGLVSEDVLFTYPSLTRCRGVVHIGSCKYNYLQRGGSITHSAYSEKSKGLLVYPKAVWENVYENFPKLKAEADYYRFSRAIIYIDRLYRGGLRENNEAMQIRKHLQNIVKNNCFSQKEKLRAVFMSLHLWNAVLKIKRILGKGE